MGIYYKGTDKKLHHINVVEDDEQIARVFVKEHLTENKEIYPNIAIMAVVKK